MAITLPENLKLSDKGFEAAFTTACIKADELLKTPLHIHYTNHDIDHSYRIIKIISSLLTGTKAKLCDAEKFVLLTAIVLHDMGMQTPNNNNSGKRQLSYKALEKIRAKHHIYSEKLIIDSVAKPDGKYSFGLDSQKVYVDDIAFIAKNHRKTDISSLPDYMTSGNIIRRKLLSALIRLGDALDLDSRRVNIERLSVFPIPVESKFHWYAHEYVSSLSVDNQKVEIYLEFPPSYENTHFVTRFKEHVKNEIVRQINEVYDILDGYGIRLYKNVVWHTKYSSTKLPMPDDLEQYIESAGFEEPNISGGAPGTGANKTTGTNFHNLPSKNKDFTGRDDFLDNIHSNFLSGRAPLRQTITGLGGVGKTQTAIEYAYRYKENYDDILWVDAGSNLQNAYRAFAKSRDLPSDENVEWSFVLSAVRNWFDQNERFLLILDNVVDFGDKLEDCLPREKGHVLITTRKDYCPWESPEELDCFQPDEAVDFINKMLGRDEGKYARNLAARLAYLPLALEQATTYICVNSKRVTCKDYLSLLKDKGLAMFNEDDAKPRRYEKSINATWQISLGKIKSKSAEQLFNMCAYMAPDNIPLSLFIKARETLPEPLRTELGEQKGLIDVISALTEYSLVKGDKEFLSIHRLVQEVVREKLKFANDTQYLSFCLNMASKGFKYDPGNKQSRDDMRHIWTIAEHVAKMHEMLDNDENTQMKIAWLYHISGGGFFYYEQYNEALLWSQKALDIDEKKLDKDNPDTAGIYNNMAIIYNNQCNFDKALYWNQKALDIREKVLGKEHPDTAATYNYMAIIYNNQGDYDKALLWYQKALDIQEKALGNDHPDTAATYNYMAAVYFAQGDYDKALMWCQKALDIYEKVLGKDHPETARTYNNIAIVYMNQGDHDKALLWLQKALDIREKVLGKDHPDTAGIYTDMANVYYEQGDYDVALSWFQKDLDIREKMVGKNHPDTAITYYNMSIVYSYQGDYDKALSWYFKSYKIFLSKLGETHPSTNKVKDNMEFVYQIAGENEPFEQWLQREMATAPVV